MPTKKRKSCMTKTLLHTKSALNRRKRPLRAPRPSYKRVVDHIDHVVKLVGPDHVGIGSDFDGIDVCPEGLEDVSYVPAITEELYNRGYSPQDIEKIMGGNFLRLCHKTGLQQTAQEQDVFQLSYCFSRSNFLWRRRASVHPIGDTFLHIG